LILGGKVADTQISSIPVTFGQIGVLFFGVAASLLIEASQYFLHAKEYDVFSIPQRYTELLKDDCSMRKKDWNDFEDEQTSLCKTKEVFGRRLYNYAIFAMFFGLFFTIFPYNIPIAFIVSGLGIVFEIEQMYHQKKR
jgi:hypothetical protein